ncbi:hypothetical protein ANO11243_035310 [Dothideomycetidae sp. 11243]|nr:hypothetical protein ANO11243_035310 [fungal sp. No.11243]
MNQRQIHQISVLRLSNSSVDHRSKLRSYKTLTLPKSTSTSIMTTSSTDINNSSPPPQPFNMSTRLLLRRPLRLTPQFRPYHSPTDPPNEHYTRQESAILTSALRHVPSEGFSSAALRSGLREQGYTDAASALFPAGVFELVRFHLRRERGELYSRVTFPESAGALSEKEVGARVRSLLLARLRGNVDAGVVHRWSEALGWMSLAGSVPGSLKELGLLADEILFLAGDVTVDGGWYTKRAGLSTVYAAAEVFQSQDQSTDFRDTEQFLDRRLEETRTLGGAASNFGEWASFQGISAVNLARSWGMRI